MPEIPEALVVLAEGEQFALRSGDDGATYLLSCKAENTAAHLHGEDAAAFFQEYESAKTQYPGYSTDQLLAQLWDQGGYSWMAEPDDA